MITLLNKIEDENKYEFLFVGKILNEMNTMFDVSKVDCEENNVELLEEESEFFDKNNSVKEIQNDIRYLQNKKRILRQY